MNKTHIIGLTLLCILRAIPANAQSYAVTSHTIASGRNLLLP